MENKMEVNQKIHTAEAEQAVQEQSEAGTQQAETKQQLSQQLKSFGYSLLSAAKAAGSMVSLKGKLAGEKFNEKKACRQVGTLYLRDRNGEESAELTQAVADAQACAEKQAALQAELARHNTSENRRGIAILSAAVVIVLLLCVLLSGRSCNTLVKKYMDASFGGDSKAVIALMPDKLIDYVVDEQYDGKKADFIAAVEKQVNNSQLALVEDYRYEITNQTDMDKADLEYYEDLYDEAGLKLNAGRTLNLTVTMTINGTEHSTNLALTAVKAGGSWCILGV